MTLFAYLTSMLDETVNPKTEKSEEKETLKTDDSQTVENADDASIEGEDDGKQEEKNPYEEQIEELRAKEKNLQEELEKKDDIISKKNRALESEKKKRREELEEKENALIEEPDEEKRDDLRDDIAELKKQVQTNQDRLVEAEIDRIIVTFTTDEKEQEAVKLHYKHTIQKSDNLKKDILNAWAVANAKVVVQERRKKQDEEDQEDFLTGFQSSDKKSNVPYSDPIKRKAAAFLDKINPNAKKYL